MRVKSIPKASSQAVVGAPPTIFPLRLHRSQFSTPNASSGDSPLFSSANGMTHNSVDRNDTGPTPNNRPNRPLASEACSDLPSLTTSANLLFNLFKGTDKIHPSESPQLPSSRSSPSGQLLEDHSASVPTHTPSDYPRTFLNLLPDFRFVFQLQIDAPVQGNSAYTQAVKPVTEPSNVRAIPNIPTKPSTSSQDTVVAKKSKQKSLEYAVASSDNCACSLCARGVPNGYEANIGNALQVIMWVLSELRLIDLTRNCSTASYHSIKKDILPFLKKHAGVLLGGIAKLPDSLFKTCIKIMTRNSNLFMNFERYPTGKVSPNDQLWKLKPSINPYEMFTSAVVPHEPTLSPITKPAKASLPDAKKRPLSPAQVFPTTEPQPQPQPQPPPSPLLLPPTPFPTTIVIPRPKSMRTEPPALSLGNLSAPETATMGAQEAMGTPHKRAEQTTTHIKIRLTPRPHPAVAESAATLGQNGPVHPRCKTPPAESAPSTDIAPAEALPASALERSDNSGSDSSLDLSAWSARVGDRRCGHCNTGNTVLWRQGPDGKGTLCNACGVRWKRGIIKVTSKRFAPMTFAHDAPTGLSRNKDFADGLADAAHYAARRHGSVHGRLLAGVGADADADEDLDDIDDEDELCDEEDGLCDEEDDEEIDITVSQDEKDSDEQDELLETNEAAPDFSPA